MSTGKPRQSKADRNAKVWRVQVTDYVNGGKRVTWIEKGPPHPKYGWPTLPETSVKSPMGLWTYTEAKRIADGRNRPWGTKPRAKAKAVKDPTAAGEVKARMPTGEAEAA